MINHYKNFIFDLDGTVLNSSKEVFRCFSQAFAKANYRIDENRLNSDIIGPPLRDIVKLIAPELKNETKIDEIVDCFTEIYDNDTSDISVIYSGMYDFLNELKNLNKKLFIATFKPTAPTLRIIKQFNFNMFDDIYTIDRDKIYTSKADMINDIVDKYNLSKSETVMIGDAASDVKAAKTANVTAIGALWGYGSDKTDLINNSDYVAQNIDDLRKLK